MEIKPSKSYNQLIDEAKERLSKSIDEMVHIALDESDLKYFKLIGDKVSFVLRVNDRLSGAINKSLLNNFLI